MWIATGSTATVARQRAEPLRPAPLRRDRSKSCCDRAEPADQSDTHEAPAVAPVGRTTRQTRLRNPPTDPPSEDTPREPSAPPSLDLTPAGATRQSGRRLRRRQTTASGSRSPGGTR